MKLPVLGPVSLTGFQNAWFFMVLLIVLLVVAIYVVQQYARRRLCFQGELGQFGDDVVVCAAPKIGRGVHLIHLGVGAAQRSTEGEARAGRHQMAHGHRAIQRHKLAILQHLQIGELWDERRDGIVELPLAFFIEEQHCDGDDRFGHRSDAEDGVFSQRFPGSQRLTAVATELHELSMAGDHHAYSGVMAGIDLGLHGAVEAVQAFRTEAD